jgi:hypothetical protein
MATYVTIPGLPAGTALTGLEQFEAVQSATSVKLTALQIEQFVKSNPSFFIEDSLNTSVTVVLSAAHLVDNTPGVGIGTAIGLVTQTDLGVSNMGTTLASVVTSLSPPSAPDFDFVISNVASGSIVESARFTSDQRLGVGTSTPQATIHGQATDALNSSVLEVARLTHNLSNSATAGAGTGLAFALDDISFPQAVIGQISSVATTAFSNADMVISVTNSGTLTEAGRFTSGKRLGVGTVSPATPLEVAVEDSGLSTVASVGRFTHTVSSTPAAGIGAAIDFQVETFPNVNKISGAIYSQSTDVTPSLEKFDLGFATMINGAAGSEVMRLTSTRRLGLNTATPAVTYQQIATDAATNTVSSVMRLTHVTSGTPANGYGSAIEFEDETTVGNNEIGVQLCSVVADTTATSEDFDFSIRTMTAGAAPTEKLKVGNFVNAYVPMGVGSISTDQAWLHLAAGTTARSAIDFDPGTLLTSTYQGAMEFDSTNLYFSPQALQRGFLPSMQFFQLGADFTANGAITTTQTLFNRAVTVSANTRYAYELNFTITNTAATAKSLQYALAGTATLAAHDYEAITTFAASAVTPTASTLMQNRITTAFPTLVTVTAASGAAAGAFTVRIRGTFDILSSGGGTVNFQFGLTAVGTAVTVVAGSNASVWPLNGLAAITDNTSIGSWA